MDISIMIKPASSNCNLRCTYCFYNSLSKCREMQSHGFMSEETLRSTLKNAFDFAGKDKVMLSFQGGEPLLAGKDFFYNLHKLIRELNVNKCPVYICVQTNGTLIDDEWCKIFKRGGYLIGLSLDGDKIANKNRIDKDGKETFDRVLESVKLLQKNNVEFNILCVLTKQVANRIEDIYAFYKKNKLKHLQFIPMLKPLKMDQNNEVIFIRNNDPFPSVENDLSLSKEDYAKFLKECFNLYLKDFKTLNYTSIRQFDNFVRLVNLQPCEQCGLMGHCSHQFVIEGDGQVYPCDFFCLDEYSLGNINSKTFFDMVKSNISINFIKESFVVEDKCKKCEYYTLCGNGCKRERIDIDKCDAYKEFFAYAIPYMKNMH